MHLHEVGERDHLVGFYETQPFLVESVRDFLVPALGTGDAAIVVATAAHRELFEQALQGAGIDLADAVENGRYVSLDAAETLSNFMVDGVPDRARFRAAIGAIIARAAEGPRRVRIFGEMVALLWAEGNLTGAIKLEELWNELADSHPFSLFCAYPISGFDAEATTAPFRAICESHSCVIPSESYSTLSNANERLRSVALLQQKANSRSYESEVLRTKQRQLEDAFEQLKEVDRLRNDFVAMVVHDLRSPLASIAGLLRLLHENRAGFDEEQIDDLLHRGTDSAHRMMRLVDDILTVARLESGEFTYHIKPFDLPQTLYRAVGAAKVATPDVRFHVEIPHNLPPALGDDARQLQILNNLLTNAVKFSPENSAVFVTVVERSGDVIVSVRDEGAGIAREHLPKVFERFSRFDDAPERNAKGTGLGLYIAKGLVEGQGGTIWAESEKGKGSCFSYTIPLPNGRTPDYRRVD